MHGLKAGLKADLKAPHHDFFLSPTERKQRHDVLTALATLEAAVHELQNRSDSNPITLKSREILSNTDQAIGTLKTFVDRQFIHS